MAEKQPSRNQVVKSQLEIWLRPAYDTSQEARTRTRAQSPIRSVLLPLPARADRAAPSATRADLRERQQTGMERQRLSLCAASSLPASSTAFVISSTNSGMPSVRSTMSCLTLAGSDLLPVTRSIRAAISRCAETI